MRLLLVLFALVCCSVSRGAEPEPRWTGGFAAISTPDAGALANWYREMFGFEALQQGGSPDGKIKFALLKRGEHLLEIIQRAEAADSPAPPKDASYRRGIFKLGFVVPNLDELEASLRKKNADFSHGIVRPAGNPLRAFAVRDPDGNVVQVFGK